MKIGCAKDIDKVESIAKAGYELIELSVGTISELTMEELKAYKARIEASGLKCISCNGLISSKVTPLYMDGGMHCSREYLERVLPMLAYLGVKTVVFGSGKFRMMPEEVAPERQYELLRDFMVMLESIARANDILVVIEPLNSKETNTILTTKAAMEFVRELELPNLKLLVDLYHFYCENEPMERIYEYGPYIKHVHIAEPTGRRYMTAEDEYDYEPFFKALKDIGYDGPVVFEGGRGGEVETGIVTSHDVLKSYCLTK